MLDEQSPKKEETVKKFVAESGLDLPQAYLDFLRNRDEYVLDVEAGIEWEQDSLKFIPLGFSSSK